LPERAAATYIHRRRVHHALDAGGERCFHHVHAALAVDAIEDGLVGLPLLGHARGVKNPLHAVARWCERFRCDDVALHELHTRRNDAARSLEIANERSHAMAYCEELFDGGLRHVALGSPYPPSDVRSS
jgi:hypothetical protein